MKKYFANVTIMPITNILDPQGKAVSSNVQKMGFETVENIRIGKHITMEINAKDSIDAKNEATKLCDILLCNKILETYKVEIFEN